MNRKKTLSSLIHLYSMKQTAVADLDARDYIILSGAKVHNLKNISLAIPKNKLVVITGLSGSGKSSLAFDTLYAEGQRRYVESLSSYARQFLGRMNKPEVDYIKGIAPAIAIEQKVTATNPRSTVGTSTEIYDYLKLLYARIGKTISPISGNEVKRDTVDSVTSFILKQKDQSTITIFSAVHPQKKRNIKEELAILLQKGYKRVLFQEKISKIEDLIADESIKNTPLKNDKDLQIIIDRIVLNISDEDIQARIADSVQTAFFEGHGECFIEISSDDAKPKMHQFCDRFELDGITFEEPSVHFFSFNNPFGACKTCEGYGKVIGIDPDLVIPDKSKSVYEGAIAPWRGEKMREWLDQLVKTASKFDFPIHRPFSQLTKKEVELLWTGNKHFEGLNAFFKHLEEQTYKIQYRVILSRYRGRTNCSDCKGSRLRKDAGYVIVGGKSITEVVLMPVEEIKTFFDSIKLNAHDEVVAKRILTEIRNRLKYLCDVGLGYLTLNRLSNTLSGGESQRINLSTSLGSSLVGSIYILDEPSIGLHSRDTQRLITVLKSLRDACNTVIVVEHDEEVMQAADHIIDIGPEAGRHGGTVVFEGNYEELLKDKNSLTGKYLSGVEAIAVPTQRRKWSDSITIKSARENNLKNIDVKFPLNTLTAVTGVSGSGKTSLVKRILVPALQKQLGVYNGEQTGVFDSIEGDLNSIKAIEMVDQNPIGKSSRSNPVTYVKAYDEIRNLFSSQNTAKALGLKPSHFSFNVDGGRCEVCQGEGEVKVEMQFMADIFLPCESCGGKRFKQEVLDVTYKEKNISDVLNLTIDEAIEFFKDEKKILQRIQPLADVGLGYVQLGQSSNTLSGGEAQRIKLASFLVKGNTSHHTLFVFDEPTTGLHFHDIKKLLKSFEALIEQGNSIIVIEHNLDVVKCADWVIDIGLDGGDKGGNLIFEGTPEEMIKNKKSYTAKFLAEKL
jgi:excinuclease ABC subunit A